ncbi:MAG TPA: lipoyl(octanoyl) transferase LipB, partial [Thermoplasmata archaeon]|nr:lipoyl(octanoyl) transferase LipB [Thermoplasmata archaeon]
MSPVEPLLEHRDWGRREYGASLAEMHALRARRRRGEIPDTLVFVEHPGVITVGVQGREGDVLPNGLPVFEVERGGKSTYHGPGQLVGYPIVDLTPRGRDVRRYVHDLEEVVIRALSDASVTAGRRDGHRGVWVEGRRKIASVGIAVEEWVAFHGFAVNVATDLAVFRSFHPCGLSGDVMTSVTRECGVPVSVEELKGPILRAWETVFGPPDGPPVAYP